MQQYGRAVRRSSPRHDQPAWASTTDCFWPHAVLRRPCNAQILRAAPRPVNGRLSPAHRPPAWPRPTCGKRCRRTPWCCVPANRPLLPRTRTPATSLCQEAVLSGVVGWCRRVREVACPKNRHWDVSRSRWSQSRFPVAFRARRCVGDGTESTPWLVDPYAATQSSGLRRPVSGVMVARPRRCSSACLACRRVTLRSQPDISGEQP